MPLSLFNDPTPERGAELYRNYQEALAAWIRCARVLTATNQDTGDSMMTTAIQKAMEEVIE